MAHRPSLATILGAVLIALAVPATLLVGRRPDRDSLVLLGIVTAGTLLMSVAVLAVGARAGREQASGFRPHLLAWAVFIILAPVRLLSRLWRSLHGRR